MSGGPSQLIIGPNSILSIDNKLTSTKCRHDGIRILRAQSSCFWKSVEIEKKQTRGQKWSDSGQNRSEGAQKNRKRGQDNIRRIHTCLPYTSLETTSYPDRQEPQHTGPHHQPQEQALPDIVKTLDGLSSTTSAALRKNLRLYPTRRRTFQLSSIPYRARPGHLRPASGKRKGFGDISALSH